jgi:hypothetical protein
MLKKNLHVPSISSLVKARLEFKKVPFGSGSNMRGQQIRVPGNTAFFRVKDRDVRSQDEGQVKLDDLEILLSSQDSD